jgi:hypothetical protein
MIMNRWAAMSQIVRLFLKGGHPRLAIVALAIPIIGRVLSAGVAVFVAAALWR